MSHRTSDFSGAKLALFIGSDLLTVLRDDRPDIPYPNHWDLPGGGREGDESPETCALRETREEVGLEIAPEALVWARRYPGQQRGSAWFFAAHLPRAAQARIRLGDEGQRWCLMPPQAFCAHPRAVDYLRHRLGAYLGHPGFRGLG